MEALVFAVNVMKIVRRDIFSPDLVSTDFYFEISFDWHIIVCSENCPSSRPFPCDKICVRDQRDCTVEKMQIARSSLGITQGIFGIISSSLRIVGTAGLGPLIGAFGIGQSGFGTGTSYLNVLETLTKYPMCYEYPKETEKSRLIKYSLKSYSHIMAQYCKLPDPVVETFF